MTDPTHAPTPAPHAPPAAPAPHGAPAGHGAGHGADHAAHHAHQGGLSTIGVFMILMVVTIIEVAWAYLALPKGFKNTMFVVMALYKAVMVALYFMHLRFERRTMWIIAAAPLIFGVILAIGAYPDSEKGTGRFKRGELDPWTTGEPAQQHE
jgi:cytochrome c oxidase subunit 4